jgi:hypothetical protein
MKESLFTICTVDGINNQLINTVFLQKSIFKMLKILLQLEMAHSAFCLLIFNKLSDSDRLRSTTAELKICRKLRIKVILQPK